jgi:plastocyanin
VKRRIVVVVAVALAAAAAALPTLTAGASSRASKGGQSAAVTLKEYSISGKLLKPAVFGKASVLKAGKTTFTFKNAGKFAHNFTIVRTSPGATKFHSASIAAGKSQTLSVNLKPGSYVAVCTLFNGFHQAAGMVRAFSVGTFNNGKWGS